MEGPSASDPAPSPIDGVTPDDVARDALLHMIDLAGVDGVITPEERHQVNSFRRHMGLSKAKARRYWRAARKARPIPRTHDERVALMSMLAGVAYADGRLCPAERRMFLSLGNAFELSALRLGELLGKAEAASDHRASHRRRWHLALAAIAVVGLGAWAVAAWGNDGDEMAVFKPLQQQVAHALALVQTHYTLDHHARPTDRRAFVSSGSGFFVRHDGVLVTNKHVLEPWKFPGESADLLEAGYTLDSASVDVRVWLEGARLPGGPGPDQCASTRHGSVTILGAGADVMRPVVARGPTGDVFTRMRHARNNNDIALLKVDVSAQIHCLALTDDAPKPLDPVMVMGYPRGRKLASHNLAQSSASLGRIRTVGDTLHITAPIVSGNSGGPLIDANGSVLGIVTRTDGDATLGCCIRAEHIRALLPQ